MGAALFQKPSEDAGVSMRGHRGGASPPPDPTNKGRTSPEKQLHALPSSTTQVPLPQGTCSWFLRAPRELWQGASHLHAASVMLSTRLIFSLLSQCLRAASSQWGVEAAAHLHPGGILASTSSQQPSPSPPCCRLCVAEMGPGCHCQRPSAHTP